MRTSIAGAVTLAKPPTQAEIDRRDRRAGAAIAAAMRRQVPDVGARVETTDRFSVEFEMQIAVVECLELNVPGDRYAVVSTSYFGFGAVDEQPPMRVELEVLGSTLCHWSAVELAKVHLRRARIRAAIAYAVEQGGRDTEYADDFVDEAVDAVLAEVGSQVPR